MKILIADAFDKGLPKRLEKFGEVFDDAGRVAEADVILVRSKTKADRAYIDRATNVKLFIRGGVGMDNIDQPYCKEKGIQAMNTPEASSVAVAELAMALMIALPSRLIEGHNGIVAGKFLKSELKRTELYQKTLGLIGVGRIGTEVAMRAQAFGMKVVAADKVIDAASDRRDQAPRRRARRVRLPLAAHAAHRRDEGHDQPADDREDEEGRDPDQHRPRQVRRRGGHRRGPRTRASSAATARTSGTRTRSTAARSWAPRTRW